MGGKHKAQLRHPSTQARRSLDQDNTQANLSQVDRGPHPADPAADPGNRGEVPTPNLDALAAESLVMERCLAVAPFTVVAVPSLMTGRHWREHGVHGKGQALADSFVTLAEILSERGFATAAFVSGNAHFRDSRVAQGFQDYDQPASNRVNRNEELRLYRPADETTDVVIEWLEGQRDDGPFFLWVHYFDPHDRYQAPPPFTREFVERRFASGVDNIGIPRHSFALHWAHRRENLRTERCRCLDHPLLVVEMVESEPDANVVERRHLGVEHAAADAIDDGFQRAELHVYLADPVIHDDGVLLLAIGDQKGMNKYAPKPNLDD